MFTLEVTGRDQRCIGNTVGQKSSDWAEGME